MNDRRVDQYFTGGDLVVDLGCGDGAWIESVLDRYSRSVGIDIAANALTAQGKSGRTWEFIHGDLNEDALPLLDGCADAVLANQVVEHVSNPMHLVAEAYRILRPGGVFVATTPNVRYLRHIARLVVNGRGPMTSGEALRTPQVWDDGHIHFFTSHDLEWLAQAGGFSRVSTSALISTKGRVGGVRRALDQVRSKELVKGFLSGNVMLVAWK